MSDSENYLVAEIDGHELACVIAEAAMGVKRPVGKTAKEAMQGFDPDVRQGFYDAALAASNYVATALGKAKKVN